MRAFPEDVTRVCGRGQGRCWRRAAGVAMLAALAAGCGGGESQHAGDKPDRQSVESKAPPTASITAATPNSESTAAESEGRSQTVTARAQPPQDDKPLVVPDGATVDELVEFLRVASARRTEADSPEEFRVKAAQKAEAMIAASDRILAAESSAAARYEALANKFNALQAISELAIDGAESRLAALATEAPPIIDAILREKPDAALRPQAIGLKLNALFIAAGRNDAVQDAFLAELAAASDDDDPAVVNEARRLAVHYRMARLLGGEDSDAAPLVAAVSQAVAVDSPDPHFFQQAREIVAHLERSGHVEAAVQIAEKVGAAYSRFDDEQLSQVAELWAESVRRRLGVVGTEVAVEGTLAAGGPLDWASLRGKVVLVDFWATWCRPCVESLPELEELYARHRSDGFEIVGVTLDFERADLDAFLAQRKLPWLVVANMLDKTEAATEPNVERFGVEGIPWVVLVDRQGRAAAVGLHGEQLAAKVEELLAQ